MVSLKVKINRYTTSRNTPNFKINSCIGSVEHPIHVFQTVIIKKVQENLKSRSMCAHDELSPQIVLQGPRLILEVNTNWNKYLKHMSSVYISGYIYYL